MFYRTDPMKNFFRLFLLLLIPLSASAYEGVLEFKISSGDRDWKMVCSVKDTFVRAEIYLGSTHFQTILQNEEGLLLLDELNKQVIPAGLERDKWGKPGEPQYKVDNKGDYEEKDSFSNGSISGTTYSIRNKRKEYLIDVAENMGEMPGVFLDQFTSLRGLHDDGRILLKEHPGMPVRIYRNKKGGEALFELVSSKAQAVDSGLFVVGEGYIRAKMRFKMR